MPSMMSHGGYRRRYKGVRWQQGGYSDEVHTLGIDSLGNVGSDRVRYRWPGDAPIADGKVDGDRITFTATGRLTSTTGIPTCRFVVTVHGDEMVLTMSVVANPGGPIGSGVAYEYKGKRIS
jgi:hypothetical protein